MKNVIALDIGGTNFRGARINNDYVMEEIKIYPTQRGDKDLFVNNVISLIDELKNKDTISISIGIPGRVSNAGFIYDLPNVGIKEIDLANILNKHYGLPVSVKNDAEVASIGEANLGEGKDYNSLYFITISTGLGGAYTLNKDFVPVGKEIGHQLVLYKGKYYEYEHLMSGTGLKLLAKLNKLKISSSKELFELVDKKDPKANKILETYINLLNKFLAEVTFTYQPDIITITGGVMKSKKYFFNKLSAKGVIIKETKLGENAGLIGAGVVGFKIAK